MEEIEYVYWPVPAYDFIRLEIRITPDLTVECEAVEPDYLAITREVAEQG
jgi:hypothetical protein